MLKPKRLAKYPGVWIHADGRITRTKRDAGGELATYDIDPYITGEPFETGKYRVHVGVTIAGKATRVHRMVCEAFHGRPGPDQRLVRHLDGDPQNNRVRNLAWGTFADNRRDSQRHGNKRRTPAQFHAMALAFSDELFEVEA